MAAKKHLVHVFPSFGAGGVPIRIAGIVNRFGDRCRHTVVALDGNADAAARIEPGIDFDILTPDINKRNVPGTLCRITGLLRRLNPDILLTYNWGSMEWALVNRFTARLRHIHFESGFGPEESDRQLRRRVLFRRLALARAERIVVPSQSLVSIIDDIWRLDAAKVDLVPNGVDCARFAAPPDASLARGLVRGANTVVLGTVAPLRAEKNLARLVGAFAKLPDEIDARLLIVGDGPERPALEALAKALGVAGRTVFTGYVDRPEGVFGLIDLFAMSSDTEQMPNALLQAMAGGRAVIATDVGDIRAIVAEPNRPYVVARDDATAYLAGMASLLQDPALRAHLGAENRRRVNEVYSLDSMVAAYERILLA